MKKLISVFAALALVGSLAAQRGKKPAKAPAKPAVAAPAVPAMPAAVTAAPAAAGAAKGIGLFIEGRGTYTMGQGTSDKVLGTGDVTAATYTVQNPATQGFGGGGTIGYNIVQNLGFVVGFDYRNVKSRKWEQSNGLNQAQGSVTALGAGGSATIQNTTNTSILTVGFRPSVVAGPGSFYAGMGFAYVLPYDSTTNVNYTTGAGAAVSVEQKSSYNAGIGVYGEMGYNFNITDNIYAGLGFRAVVATANNDGKATVSTTTTAAGTTTATTNYSSSVSATTSAFQTIGITDAGVNINVGVRF